MKQPFTVWKWVVVLAALVALTSTSFAVTKDRTTYLIEKISRGEALTSAEEFDVRQVRAETGMDLWGYRPAAQDRLPDSPLDEYQYSEIDYEWTDITGNGTVTVNGDDMNSGALNLGFTFNFYGNSYTTVNVCSNGWISFGSNVATYINTAIPAAAEPNNAIYAYWDDMNPGAGGDVYYFSDVANQRFIVSWVGVFRFGTTNPYSFQIVLEAPGTIKLYYQSMFANNAGTIGVENSTGTEALQVCFDTNGWLPPNESGILIGEFDGVPVAPTNLAAAVNGTNVTLTWNDPEEDTNGNPLTPTSLEILQGAAVIGTVGAGVETYAVNGLQAGSYVFSVRAVNGEYTGASTSVPAIVGNPSYASDFEADNGSLESSGGWEWGEPTLVTPHSGTHCWATVLNDNYEDAACYNLDINQELTVGSADATLEFYMWYDAEANWDGMNIQVSTDAGATWTVVEDVVPAYEGSINGLAECWADINAWNGTEGSWRLAIVQLGAFVGQTPIIRFAFTADELFNFDGFYIDDVVLWGFGEPEFANVSGTVTFDGGAGVMTAVTVSANGIGNPTTNPAANGTYTLTNVLLGNRTVTASLAGYHDASVPVVLTAGGATNINLTLVRLDPPTPEGLAGSVDNATGIATLTWTASTDPLVDQYRIYRRQSGGEWAQTGTANASPYTETLPADGIYQYAITAVDLGVSTPVESEMTGAITVLYGELPVTSIGCDGDFDDRISLTWLEPGTLEGTEVLYDDGTSETWFRVATPNGPNDYFCVRFTAPDDAPFPLMLYAANIYMERSDALPYVAICPPNQSNTGADLDNALYEWNDIGADGDPGWLFAETDGSVMLATPGDWYVVIQFPPGGTGPGCGSDNSAPDLRSYWTNSYPTWNAWAANDWMMRMWVGGPPPEGPAAVQDQDFFLLTSGGPTGYAVERLPSMTTTPAVQISEKGKANSKVTLAETPNFSNPLDRWFAPYSRAPHAQLMSRNPGHSLDDIQYYKVFRNGTEIGQPTETNYVDLNRIEGTDYSYYVLAHYDNNQDSPPSPTIVCQANMPPAAPTGLVANASGQTQMVLAWTAPTTNADNTPLVDLANYRVYRDGTMITTVPAGTTTYIDTPPVNDQIYTWTVTAMDEVPNESDPSNAAIGAVVSPWEPMDCDWVDITGNGTVVVNGDDMNSGLMALPWDFEFYGTTYNQFSICSNGWISFTSTSTSLGGTIPSAAEPNAAIYGMYMDLNPVTAGDVYMYDDVANDQLIISWVGVPQYANPTNLFSFQIILEPPSAVYISYLLVTTPSGDVGVENATGSDAIVLWDGAAGPFTPANNTCVGFWAGPSGAITGLIREFGTNTPIQGASAWTAEDPSNVATTDATGTFTLEVEPGTYELHVFKQGYCEQVFPGVQVDDGGTTTRNASLRQPNAQFSVSTLNMFCNIGDDAFSAFEITNPAPATCDVSYTVTSSQNWLTVSPNEGDVLANQSQAIAVTADVSGFSEGTYSASLTVNHNDTNNPYVIECFVEVGVPANDSPELPTEFALHANYPNPFNATTSLNFDVPNESHVELVIFNVAGQEVARPVDQVMAAGKHTISYTANDLPSGMYLVQMKADHFNAVQKIVLLK